jgi:hypothetical protein
MGRRTNKTLISYCINKCLVRIQCHGHEDNQLWRPDRVLPARSGAPARAAALCSCLCSSGEISLWPWANPALNFPYRNTSIKDSQRWIVHNSPAINVHGISNWYPKTFSLLQNLLMHIQPYFQGHPETTREHSSANSTHATTNQQKVFQFCTIVLDNPVHWLHLK